MNFQTKITRKYLNNNNGLTLVEVIASVLLLSIIIISIFTMIIQSAKTTKTAENVVEANYLAQSEIEKIFALSKDENEEVTMGEILNQLLCKDSSDSDCYQGENNTTIPFKETTDPHLEYFVKTDSNTGFYIKFSIEDITTTILGSTSSEPILTRVLIRVYDQADGTLQSQLEQTIQWGA